MAASQTNQTQQLSLFEGDAPRPLTKGGELRHAPGRGAGKPPPILLPTAAPPGAAPPISVVLVARLQGEAVTLTLGEAGAVPTIWQHTTRA